jgi:hypothetical protein
MDYLPIVLVAATSLFLLVSKNWRLSVLALALQYVAVFWMVLEVWSLGLSVVKLIGGWMAGAVLGTSILAETENAEEISFVEQRFKIILTIIIWIIVYSIAPQLQKFLSIPVPLILGGVTLITVGILQFGITTNPIRVIFGLLTCFSGFEVLYAGMENSILVAGFLVIITLGIALVGALFIHQQEGDLI